MHDCCRVFKAYVLYRKHLYNSLMLWSGVLALVCSTRAKVTNEQFMMSAPFLEARVVYKKVSVDIA
jgi:hypothetical protein